LQRLLFSSKLSPILNMNFSAHSAQASTEQVHAEHLKPDDTGQAKWPRCSSGDVAA
jgi:hypothetical protein